ncbi:hypothetical protein M9Y10_023075 [Tritrichomonas musculus]|uniref:Rab-GAP TBC domain-containing protein n=1 Tax=Tritrichomonas musculus TaxID=1915356 RepID=A0ABR2KU20_9EUKA
MSNEFTSPPLQFRILPLVQPSPTNQPINKQLIRQLCESGLSECPTEDRCIAWLVLLGVYSDYAIEWPEKRDRIIETYLAFVHDFGLDDWPKKRFDKNVHVEDFEVPNQKLMYLIYIDIVRSDRKFYFFPPVDIQDGDPDDRYSFFIPHVRRLERLLYIFGSLNVSLYYMQGFNELIAPLYYAIVCAKQLFDDNLDFVEAIAFQCFQQLMTGTSIQEFYMTQDDSSIIHNRMRIYQQKFNKILPDISQKLNYLSIEPIQYAYKWINLLFAQEHLMPTLLIVWDSLFAHFDDLMNYCYYVAISRVFECADKIQIDDFTATLESIQHIDIQNIYKVLKRANQFYVNDLNKPTPIEILKRKFTLKIKKK